MSGALKHFFDGIYYPCLEATKRRPYGLYVHGGNDTGGRCGRWSRSRPASAGGRSDRRSPSPDTPGKADLEACWELGALLAAEVAG